MKKNCCFFLLLLLLPAVLPAQYRIVGNTNLGDNWQPKIFLAAINKMSDYYRTSPDMIVNTAVIGVDGRFVLEGDNLPDEPRFYRLYLMKKQNTDYDACLYVGGDDHNFVHLILENGAAVEIRTSTESAAPFGSYSIVGSPENVAMQNLSRIVFPSFYFHRIKFPTELKFSEDKLHTDLKHFADTCRFPLVALAAINNTDFDEYFEQDRAFYQAFCRRLESEVPKSVYTRNYLLKVRYYANEDGAFPNWARLLLGLSVLLTAGLAFLVSKKQKEIVGLEKEIRALKNNRQTAATVTVLERLKTLTGKEEQILQLIRQGKSNKEIASELFVELSTVKTHINKLYGKLGVKNRREVKELKME